MSDPECLSILIASDIHLGINERDPIRRDDAKHTFEEIFELANEKNVDMVLLTGNLFHENKPSRKALQAAIEVLRNNCLGDREIGMELVSEQAASFHGSYRAVNYEDPNYNVQLPVFAIHGDHDDPGGEGGLSALDLLSSANLLNYFGKAPNTEKISLAPLLIRKGRTTRVALYGLGHMRDEALTRALERKEVTVGRPEPDNGIDWFNLLALHQNRAKSAASGAGALKEVLLPSCMDIVIWGHERECTLSNGMDGVPDNADVQFSVLQPGAAVATELTEQEAKTKSVAILHISGENWKLEPLHLQTVRPFLIRELCLADHEEEIDLHNEEALRDLLAEQIESMLSELQAENQTTPMTEQGESRRRYPLVRLKVDYTGYTTTNPQKFGQRFVDRVANPSSLLHFQRKPKKAAEKQKGENARSRRGGETGDDDDGSNQTDPSTQIQDLVCDFLGGGSKEQLRLLPQGVLDRCVFDGYVKKEERDAITKGVDAWMASTQKFLNAEASKARDGLGADRKAQDATIEGFLRERMEAAQAEEEAARSAATGSGGGGSGGGGSSSGAGGAGTSGGGGAAPSSGAAGAGAGGAAADADLDIDDDADDNLSARFDDDDDDVMSDGSGGSAPKGRGRGRGKAPAAAAKKPAAGRGRGRGAGAAAPKAAPKAAAGRGRGGGRQTTLNVKPAAGAGPKRSAAAASSSGVIELDDDDDDEPPQQQSMALDDDEDDAPARKSAKGAASKRAAAPSAAASRSKRAKAAAKTYNDDDDDDDDAIEDDDDDYVEEVAAPPESSKRSSAFSRRRMR